MRKRVIMETRRAHPPDLPRRPEPGRRQQSKSPPLKNRTRLAKRVVGWGVPILVVAAIAIGVIGFYVRAQNLGQAFADQGQQHIAIGASHEPYNSNPPTSGPHHLEPAAWGIYQRELPDETLVHNLEHGGIWISYHDIDAATKQQIEALAREYPDKLIVTPRARDDAKIVVASWRRLVKLERFDADAVVAFIRARKNRAPEPNAM